MNKQQNIQPKRYFSKKIKKLHVVHIYRGRTKSNGMTQVFRVLMNQCKPQERHPLTLPSPLFPSTICWHLRARHAKCNPKWKSTRKTGAAFSIDNANVTESILRPKIWEAQSPACWRRIQRTIFSKNAPFIAKVLKIIEFIKPILSIGNWADIA